MPNLKIIEEQEKPDYIEIRAETELPNDEKVDRLFKFKKKQMDDDSYKEVLKGWAKEVHSDYDDYSDKVGEKIEF